MEKYIGPKKVMGISEVEEKTPLKNEMIKVLFEDGTSQVMPKVRYELITTDTPSDLTTVQNKIRARVSAMLYSTLHEYGVLMGEVNGISDAMFDLVNNGYEKAREIKFGFEHLELPLIEINNILLQNASENSDGVASTGGGSDTEN